MPTYVVLYRFTDQGRKNIKTTVTRAERIRKENEARGFKVIGTWWTQGQYDLIVAIEAPTEEAMLSGLFNIAEAGNVSSETLRAYTQGEMTKIMRRGHATTRRRTARRTTTRRTATRRTATRRTATARRTTTRRPAAKRPATRRTAAARPAARRATAARRPAARRSTAARRTTARRTTRSRRTR
jgi:uncharacterized protein with GYD domain